MDRRKLLTSALKTGLASTLLPEALAQTTSDRKTGSLAMRSNPDTPPELIGPAAEAAYFTEEMLVKAVGTSDLKKPTDVTTVAFNFPSWHPSPWMEERYGKGWTEFDTLRNAKPLFPGHTMPHYPLWGYYDEADPAWAAREIDLAHTYGVDAWMIDWYWHEGEQFYQEQLEQGMLKAPNRDKLKFAIMWANHDWKSVYPARSPEQAAIIAPQKHSLADFERVADYCCEKYFTQSNYLQIDGAPVFGIFDLGKVIQQMGEPGTPRALEAFRKRAQSHGINHLHIQVCNGYTKYAARLKEMGFDSAVIYGTFGWTYGGKPPGSRIPYGTGVLEAIASWPVLREKTNVPFHPTCSVGWDDSPRFGEFSCVAINRSPDQFERLVRAARHFTASAENGKMIYLNAWNEWTEDGVLLPDTTWGYSYLESLRRALKT
jgi:hypothetical protein